MRSIFYFFPEHLLSWAGESSGARSPGCPAALQVTAAPPTVMPSPLPPPTTSGGPQSGGLRRARPLLQFFLHRPRTSRQHQEMRLLLCGSPRENETGPAGHTGEKGQSQDVVLGPLLLFAFTAALSWASTLGDRGRGLADAPASVRLPRPPLGRGPAGSPHVQATFWTLV